MIIEICHSAPQLKTGLIKTMGFWQEHLKIQKRGWPCISATQKNSQD